MADLSILIPSRNEMFLARTIQDITTNMRGDTEVIAVLDGVWADPPIPDHPKVTLLHHTISIGQRAATNEAARLSQARYVMKVDAHCAFDEGFDIKLMEDMQDNWTVAPIMRNLHAFDWVCENGHRRYQGPSGPCTECGKSTVMDVVWIAKTNPQSSSYCFDSEPHFQYFKEFTKRPEGQGDLTESMSLQGSCFMMTRERFFRLNICDEKFGSWGSQGVEVAFKTWQAGGEVMINHKTWYAHLFRTQGGDFSFPYPISGKDQEFAKKTAHDLIHNDENTLKWLLKKFWPVPGWKEEDIGIVKEIKEKPVIGGALYYTDNRLDPEIMIPCQKQLNKCLPGVEIVSVSLKPIDFGDNIVLPLEHSPLTMFKQILAGLEVSTSDVIFFCEHDVLYHPSHFDFIPPNKDVFYYNRNNWKVRCEDGQALYYICEQTLGLCAYRELLLEHYRKRVERVEKEGWDRKIGFEPGKHAFPRGVDSYGWDFWNSPFPNIDIRHNKNLTANRWSQDEFRDKRNCQGWIMADEVPGWGVTKGRFKELLKEI